MPTLDIPDQFKYPLTHLRPFKAIPTHSDTSQALHTDQSLHYSPRVLRTHLKPFTPISDPPYPIKALHTHIRPSIPILGPLHYALAPYTNLRPTQQSQVLLTHPRHPRHIHELSYHPRPSKSVLDPPPHPLPLSITHKENQYPSQALQSHLQHFKPISGAPHPPEALQTHLTPSTPT